MRKIAISLVVGAALLAPAPAALASSPRADTYFTVWCIPAGGVDWIQFESVDAHAIDPGGKDDAIALFVQNHPGWTCEALPAGVTP
jgi:hypothetical protein